VILFKRYSGLGRRYVYNRGTTLMHCVGDTVFYCFFHLLFFALLFIRFIAICCFGLLYLTIRLAFYGSHQDYI